MSYKFLGPRWPSVPITWSFATTTYPSDAERPFSSYVTTADAQATVVRAVERWSAVSGLTIQQVPDSADIAGAAGIRVGYGSLDASGYVGLTNYFGGPTFQPDVTIRLLDPADRAFDGSSGQLVYRDTSATLYQVALHEFGHALGLDHSFDPGDIMYFASGVTNRELSASDIAGIRALYPPAPVQLRGRPTDYIIAQVSGRLAYIQDTVAGRDGVRTLADLGRITFADGEGVFDPTGAAQDVARLYLAAFGRTPDARGLDDNTLLITTKTLSLTNLAASFASSPEALARYGRTDTAGFVRQLYQNVLNRAPDAAGEAQWVRAVNATSRGEALRLFSDSQENHRATLPIAGDRDDAAAARLYQAAFDRLPDAPGLAATADALSNGAPIDEVAQGFVNSGEFGRAYGSLGDEGLVTQLYQNVLHRAPDAAGKADWLSQLSAGATRGHVLAGFAESNENRIATAGLTHDAWVFVG